MQHNRAPAVPTTHSASLLALLWGDDTHTPWHPGYSKRTVYRSHKAHSTLQLRRMQTTPATGSSIKCLAVSVCFFQNSRFPPDLKCCIMQECTSMKCSHIKFQYMYDCIWSLNKPTTRVYGSTFDKHERMILSRYFTGIFYLTPKSCPGIVPWIPGPSPPPHPQGQIKLACLQ